MTIVIVDKNGFEISIACYCEDCERSEAGRSNLSTRRLLPLPLHFVQGQGRNDTNLDSNVIIDIINAFKYIDKLKFYGIFSSCSNLRGMVRIQTGGKAREFPRFCFAKMNKTAGTDLVIFQGRWYSQT